MAFNLIFLRAHNVLAQQRETPPLPLRATTFELFIHLGNVAFQSRTEPPQTLHMYDTHVYVN